MNYTKRRKARKATKEIIKVIKIAVLGIVLAAVGWSTFEERLTYKECHIYKIRSCDRR